MFVKFYSLLSKELESPKSSFIELCLHTGRYIRPRNYIISNPPGRELEACHCISFTDNKLKLNRLSHSVMIIQPGQADSGFKRECV